MSDVEFLVRQIDELTKENSKLRQENGQLKKENAKLRHAAKPTTTTHPTTPRVLELKDNPVSRIQWANKQMLEGLEQENEELLAKKWAVKDSVPLATANRLRLEVKKQKTENAQLQKRLDRLKQRYGKNVHRFVEIVYKLLGYKIEFETETKLRIIPKLAKESRILVDMGDLQQMRLKKENFKGMPEAVVDNLIRFWVVERKEVSCFFNALNLEIIHVIVKMVGVFAIVGRDNVAGAA